MKTGWLASMCLVAAALSAGACSESKGGGNDDDDAYITDPEKLCKQMGERAVECRVSDSTGVGMEVSDCIEEFDRLGGAAESRVVCIFNCWLDAPSCLEFSRLVTESEDCEDYCSQ